MDSRGYQRLLGIGLAVLGLVPACIAIRMIAAHAQLGGYDHLHQQQGLQLLAILFAFPGLAMGFAARAPLTAQGVGEIRRHLLLWSVVFALELAALTGCVLLSNHWAEGIPTPPHPPEAQTELAAGHAPYYNLARAHIGGRRVLQ